MRKYELSDSDWKIMNDLASVVKVGNIYHIIFKFSNGLVDL